MTRKKNPNKRSVEGRPSPAIGIIPSRWGSTRFPGKSLALILGKPLVQWVYEAVEKAALLDDVVVATDDARIMAAVNGFGGKAVMTASDHPSGTDRAAEAARGSGAEIVVNIQGDEPLIDPGLIDSLVRAMRSDDSLDMATAAVPIDRGELASPSAVKVVMRKDGTALYFSRSIIPCDRDGTHSRASGVYMKHVGVYAYRSNFLKRLVASKPCLLERIEKLEQLRALDIGARILVIRTDSEAVGVDRPCDIRAVEKVLARGQKRRKQ